MRPSLALVILLPACADETAATSVTGEGTDYFPFAVHTLEAFDGQQWQEVEIGYANPGVDDADWMLLEYDLAPFKNSQLRVRICHKQTEDAFQSAGWSIDDLTVGPFVCTPET